jgi:hypothetical protein
MLPLDGDTERVKSGFARAVTVKVPADALPAGPVTTIGPVVAPAGTVVVIDEGEATVKLAGAPLKVTPVAPEKPLPEIVTDVPAGPLVGEIPETVGAGVGLVTVQLKAALFEPPLLPTVTRKLWVPTAREL